MTLRSRRKRPTTAANSRAARNLDRPVAEFAGIHAPNCFEFGQAILLAGILIVGASTTLAAEPGGLNWRKPKSSGAAARSSGSAAPKRDSSVRQVRANAVDVARAPVLNAANVEPASPRVARAGEGSVVRRPQAGRFTAQAQPKSAEKSKDESLESILEGVEKDVEKQLPKEDAKPATPEMKEKPSAIDDVLPPPDRRPPGRIDDLDLPKEKPEPPKIDEAPTKKDVPPRPEEDILPKPSPTFEQPQPKLDEPTKDEPLPPLTEEECREQEAQRREYLLGADREDRHIDGDLEYCARAIEELKALRVADPRFTIDISPPKPEGVEAPRCDRDWHDNSGRVLFRGRPVDFDVQGFAATFKTVDGELKTIRVGELSNEDIGHFAMMYHLPVECVLEHGDYRPRSWVPSTFVWKASALCHKPTYFEDVHLERYGHSFGPIVQPVVSAGHFFGTFPVLPYKMGLTPPNECLYTLGYYRPGNCAPYMLDPIPWSVRAAAMEAGAIGLGIAIIP
jgi:hypothetical protein